MAFRLGQKVVCVDDTGNMALHPGMIGPTKGVVYTIRAFQSYRHCVGFYLEEIRNPEGLYQREDGGAQVVEQFFDSWRFRPVHERKTDISVFTLLLSPKKHDELV